MGETEADDLERLGKLLHAALEIDAEKPDLDRRDTAADAKQKAATAHLVEHADLFDQAQRVVKRQQIDHRSKAQMPSSLSHCGQKDTRRRRIAERRRVMLGQMIAVEPGAVVGFDQFEPLLKLLGQRHPTVVDMVKDPKTHCSISPFSTHPAKMLRQCPTLVVV